MAPISIDVLALFFHQSGRLLPNRTLDVDCAVLSRPRVMAVVPAVDGVGLARGAHVVVDEIPFLAP